MIPSVVVIMLKPSHRMVYCPYHYTVNRVEIDHLSSSPVFGGVRVAHLFSICVLSYYMSFCFEFRVVMSVTIST